MSQGSCSVHCVDALIYVLVRGLTVCMYLYMHMDSVCVCVGGTRVCLELKPGGGV